MSKKIVFSGVLELPDGVTTLDDALMRLSVRLRQIPQKVDVKLDPTFSVSADLVDEKDGAETLVIRSLRL